MVENRPYLSFLSHAVVLLGVLVIMLPIWIAFVASTHPIENLLAAPIPMWPGDRMWENYGTVLGGWSFVP